MSAIKASCILSNLSLSASAHRAEYILHDLGSRWKVLNLIVLGSRRKVVSLIVLSRWKVVCLIVLGSRRKVLNLIVLSYLLASEGLSMASALRTLTTRLRCLRCLRCLRFLRFLRCLTRQVFSSRRLCSGHKSSIPIAERAAADGNHLWCGTR
jgi:hypothetical protein